MVDFRRLDRLAFEKPARPDSDEELIPIEGDGSSRPVLVGRADGEDHRQNLYEQASDCVSQVFDRIRAQKSFPMEDAESIIARMVETQRLLDDLFITAVHPGNAYHFIIHHSVNVAIFSIKMAAGLGFDKNQQRLIGMAALLHDVGTALISEAILYKKEPLTDEELKIVRERPEISHRILGDLGAPYQELAEIAVQVYEKIDGSGYPHGLKGEDIHPFAQVIGLVDMYEALIHPRPHRDKHLHFAAIKAIIKTSKHGFERRYLKALLRIFSIFPIYSYVRLNSEAIGKVIETCPDQPMRPKLQIVFDSQKRRVLSERIVNLQDNPLLYIVDSVSEEELDAIPT